jgi:heme/copper-type cytochrome/quinol oxidase subunit 4
MSFKQFTKELNGNRVEGELLKTILYSLITSFAVIGILYFLVLKNVANFIPKYGFYLFLAAISYALILPAVRQVRAYKQFVCMSGMMIGMTIGMIAGFMSGYFIGATNGMFFGSVFGMIVGSFLGAWMGSCCGIMGVIEGIMAGFMGGLMGAMTSVMLLNDHLKLATIITTIFTAIISICLNYMIFFEMKENERQKEEDHLMTIMITFILIIVTTWLMVFGPRSALFS